ncbi:hypothetical protein FACS1894182_14130 [Bacteroidia bacterium]|nr:hypothetical protein FACS1894182_14130 [Bacteroidia bacterium]
MVFRIIEKNHNFALHLYFGIFDMEDYSKYIKKLKLWFLIGAIIVFFVCLGLLLYFALTDKQGFNSHTSVSALILSFVSCILTAFFSLATYRNGIIAKETNESNRVNNYIIENYSLINFCTEITIVGQKTVSTMVLSDRKFGKGVSTNICFLVSKYVNKPIYKILFKEIRFLDKDKKFSSSEGVDSRYQENTLNRKYDCIAVNLPFYILHHSIYRVKKQNVIENKDNQ